MELWKNLDNIKPKDKNKTPDRTSNKNKTLTKNNLTGRKLARRKKDKSPDKNQPRMTDLVKFWTKKDGKEPDKTQHKNKTPEKHLDTNTEQEHLLQTKPTPRTPTLTTLQTNLDKNRTRTRIQEIREKFRQSEDRTPHKPDTVLNKTKLGKRKLAPDLNTEHRAESVKSPRISADLECPRRRNASNTGALNLNTNLTNSCPRKLFLKTEEHMAGHVSAEGRITVGGEAAVWDSDGRDIGSTASTFGRPAADREGVLSDSVTAASIGQCTAYNTASTNGSTADSSHRGL